MNAMPKVDVCIVGAGAGGATAAMRLAEAHLSVVVLEAGPHWDPAKDFVNDPEVMAKKFRWDMPVTYTGDPADSVIGVRGHTAFGVGGGTNHWTCAVGRFHPTDFQTKSVDGVGTDWPIRYADLEPYYLLAEKQLGVSTPFPEVQLPQIPRAVNPAHKLSYASQVIQKGCQKLGIHSFSGPTAINSRPYDGRPACNYCGFCTSGCMIRANGNTLVTHIPRAQAAGAEIRANCFAREIRVDKASMAKSVIYFDSQGKEQEQEAALIVVACFAVETPRLLLNSTSGQFPNGLANSSGLVGKNLMTHLTQTGVGVFDQPMDSFRGYPIENLVTYDFYDTEAKRGFARGYKISTDSQSPMEFISLEPTLWGASLKRHAESYRYQQGLVAIAEMHPNDANTVTIDPTVKDRFGVPVARMTHQRTERDDRVIEHERQTCREILEAAGAKKVYFGHAHSGHIMGTCRMGDHPEKSVVSPCGQSHDIKNLFIADSSIFVTSASVNPTLTIVALSNRVSEYIIRNRRELA